MYITNPLPKDQVLLRSQGKMAFTKHRSKTRKWWVAAFSPFSSNVSYFSSHNSHNSTHHTMSLRGICQSLLLDETEILWFSKGQKKRSRLQKKQIVLRNKPRSDVFLPITTVSSLGSSADPDIFLKGVPPKTHSSYYMILWFPDFNGCKPFTRKVNVSSSNHEDVSTFRTFFFKIYDCILHKCCAISNQYHFTNPISTFLPKFQKGSGPPVPPPPPPPPGSAHGDDCTLIFYRCNLYAWKGYPFSVQLNFSATLRSVFSIFNPFPNDKFKTHPNWNTLQTTISDLMNMAESSPQRLKNTVEKRRNCSLRLISSFPAVFSKDLHCRQVNTTDCLAKG